RVRSFVRDLWTVLPGTERFNRGGMNIAELSSRIRQSRASAAIVVSLFKGNPRSLQILAPDGEQLMEVRMESAALRREVTSSRSPKMRAIHSIAVQIGAGEQTRAIAEMLSKLLDAPIAELPEIVSAGSQGKTKVVVWFQDFPTGKTLWTHYHAEDGLEIGPRMRITSVTV
ncbi:MAG: hypothetical protein KAT22_03680, partial [Candidatus Thorarchaeota archaeon]|nr:hypothetical protein [Candidatus Thorarchaeota archaeon]